MLKIISTMRDLDFSSLMEIYTEANLENATEKYPNESEYQGLLLAEQDFYQYLKECFFTTGSAVYAIWQVNGIDVSALRFEPYRDGMLLAALETRPDQRQRGYAAELVNASLQWLQARHHCPVYSHIHKKNIASIKTHRRCGFRKILDHAVYADGSVLHSSSTFRFDP